MGNYTHDLSHEEATEEDALADGVEGSRVFRLVPVKVPVLDGEHDVGLLVVQGESTPGSAHWHVVKVAPTISSTLSINERV